MGLLTLKQDIAKPSPVQNYARGSKNGAGRTLGGGKTATFEADGRWRTSEKQLFANAAGRFRRAAILGNRPAREAAAANCLPVQCNMRSTAAFHSGFIQNKRNSEIGRQKRRKSIPVGCRRA